MLRPRACAWAPVAHGRIPLTMACPCGARAQAEDHRAELLRLREEYEDAHPGGYERVYPTGHPRLQSLYEMLLNASLRAFVEDSPANHAASGARVPVPPLLPNHAGEDWWPMIKLGHSGERILFVHGDAPTAADRRPPPPAPPPSGLVSAGVSGRAAAAARERLRADGAREDDGSSTSSASGGAPSP